MGAVQEEPAEHEEQRDPEVQPREEAGEDVSAGGARDEADMGEEDRERRQGSDPLELHQVVAAPA